MRMSTDKETQGNSIKSQEKALLSYARKNGFTVVEKYIDEAVSGRFVDKRPAFLKMVEESGQGLFDAVLVYDSSRFARNLEESIVYKSTLKRNGVSLISITEPSLDEDTNLITDAMLGALNEMYSRKLSKAVKRGMEFNASKGVYQTAPPFGYKKQNGKMEVIAEEAKVVKLIFNEYFKKPSFHGVAVYLNSMSIKNRKGVPFRSADIKRVLKNQCYIGKVFYNNNLYDGAHDPIIDEKLFNDVSRICISKPFTRPPISYKHWLTGLLKCNGCGSGLNFSAGRNGNAYYRCSGNRQGKCGVSNFMPIKILEGVLYYVANEIVGTTEGYVFCGGGGCEEIGGLISKAIEKNQKKLLRAKDAYINGVDDISEYSINKGFLLAEKKLLLEKLNALKEIVGMESEEGYVVPTAAGLLSSEAYSVEQKNIALKGVIEKIIIDKSKNEFIVYYYE